jgi:hypothetical protein
MDEDRSEVLSKIFRDGIRSGELSPNIDIDEAQLQLLGPLMMATLYRPEEASQEFGARLVDLFLASRRAEAPQPAADRGKRVARLSPVKRTGTRSGSSS